MSNWDDDEARRNRNKGRDRDNTPSVLRQVEPPSAMRGRPTAETMPLMEMPISQRIWRRIRWPLFITAVVVLLLTIGLITRGMVVASTIEQTIKEAAELEFKGTLEQTDGAEKTLFALYKKYSGEDRACAGWGWQAVLQSLIWGKPLSDEAKRVIAELDEAENEFVAAAQAGAALLDGRAADAVHRLSTAPDGPRTSLVSSMALSVGGKREEARALLNEKIERYPTYVPLTVIAAEEAAAANDRMEVFKLSQLLLNESPTHLVAEMLVILLALPEWGNPPPEKAQLDVLQKKMTALMPRITSAPPKPAGIGQYLIGRIALAAGHADEAAAAFQKVLEQKKDPETIAYLAETVRLQGNDQAALTLLEKYADVNGPEIMDIRAQCLLSYHRVRQAEVVVEALRKTGAMPQRVQALQWLLSVRNGNMDAAIQHLPKSVSTADKWLALEMYFQLAAAGNHTGIEKTAAALEENWSGCAQIIRAWHSKALGRAMRQFENTRLECAQSLIPRLMRLHMSAELVFQAAEANRKDNRGSLIFEIDRARADWLVEGFDAAVRILDGVARENPEGAPILERLGRAYLEMNLPEKVTALLKDEEQPELLALRIFSLEMQRKDAAARTLVEKALVAAAGNAHPALQYFKMRQKLVSGNLSEVRTWVDETAIGNMGQWTSELADLGARAMWALDEKNESEKFLQKIARQALVPGGAGESLDTFMVQVEQNINRTGKYKNHALVVIRTLKEESVKDPRMSYWLASENITNGSERLGLRMLLEIPELDPAYKLYYKKMAALERLDEAQTDIMKKMLPGFTP